MMLGRFVRGIRTVLRRNEAEAEMAEEMRFHFEMEVEANLRAGMELAEARRRARLSFGGVERFKEQARDVRGGRVLEDLAGDVRIGIRNLKRNIEFTVATLLTLGLGIGAVASAVGVMDAVLLRPLPYEGADRVLRVYMQWEGTPDAKLSPAEYFDFQDRLRGFDAFGVYAFGSVNLTGQGDPERLLGGFISAGVLPALGVRPILGRNITDEEEVMGAQVALLSYGAWATLFGSDPTILGRSILLNDLSYQVVGILPPAFKMPEEFSGARPTQVLIPQGIDPIQVTDRGSHYLYALGRLQEGTGVAVGQAEVERVATDFIAQYPSGYPSTSRFSATAVPLRQDILGDVRPAVTVLMGAVVFVLLVVWANCASLLLARTENRRADFAVRAALGAGNGRIARQIMAETGLLAAGGGALGLFFALVAIRALASRIPPGIPRLDGLSFSPAVWIGGLTVMAGCGVALGAVPAVQVLRELRTVRVGTRPGSRTKRRTAASPRRLLVLGQVALAVVLLAGAGLFTQSFRALTRVDPGFDPDGVLLASLSLPQAGYPDETVPEFFAQLLDRLRLNPGVVAAGAVLNPPLNGSGLGDMNLRTEYMAEEDPSPQLDWQVATPGFFEAMSMERISGRFFLDTDTEDGPGVAVVSQRAAELLWPGRDPLGERFLLGGGAGPGWVEVVGVVKELRYEGMDQAPNPQFYIPHRQFRFWGSGAVVRSMTLVVRARGDETLLAPVLRDQVLAMDGSLPLALVRTLADVLDASVARPRFLMNIFLAFAVLALVLAAVGIYGVVSHTVGTRTRELGIRVALGAGPHSVEGMVMREGAALVGGGLLVGTVASLALSGAVESLLFGVQPADPLVLGAVGSLLAFVAMVSAWIPARRAAATDPSATLKVE